MTPMRSRAAPITPFWLRLPRFFLFPLQWEPLLYALVLSLCSLLVLVIPLPFAIILIELGILLAASRYSFKVIQLSSQGFLRTRDFPPQRDPDLVNLPWKLFAILLVMSFLIGGLAYVSKNLAIAGWAVVSFALPAIAVVLVQTASLGQSLNPALWWSVMRAMGWPYVALWAFLFFLSGGAEIALPLVAPLVARWMLLPLINFVLIYFSWAMSALLGYAMYQYHEELGIDQRFVPQAASGERDVSEEARAIDAHVADMVEHGEIDNAVGIAYDAARGAENDLHAQRRYHRVLAVSSKTDDLLRHGKRFIELLMHSKLETEALAVYQTCIGKDPQFLCDNPAHVVSFARLQWRAGDARAALALLKGFDKRNAGHAAIPDAYELAARVLIQGLDRRDMAMPILQTMKRRYPKTPQTEEVSWLLRDDDPTTRGAKLAG
ncbi:tetratricopeptide repeat protein [Variovorax sp. RT4R15]|uniref:tetratricopeptide repeat protein n=1 Tax=Variovorax sp. RT4R15 TaxID=3443737 RepID=UPI003F48A945